MYSKVNYLLLFTSFFSVYLNFFFSCSQIYLWEQFIIYAVFAPRYRYNRLIRKYIYCPISPTFETWLICSELSLQRQGKKCHKKLSPTVRKLFHVVSGQMGIWKMNFSVSLTAVLIRVKLAGLTDNWLMKFLWGSNGCYMLQENKKKKKLNWIGLKKKVNYQPQCQWMKWISPVVRIILHLLWWS